MHHYRKHIKDYRASTAHLSLLDHGIYSQLIDLYYLNESPLTSNIEDLAWEIGARSVEELTALRRILSRYFELNSDGNYTHDRIETELKAIYEKSEKARKSAQKKWDRQREKEQLGKQHSSDIDQQTCESHANASKNHAIASKIDANDMLPSNPVTHYPVTQHPEVQKISPPKRKQFKKPTAEEVADYMQERVGVRPKIEHEKFVDFYESKGWKVGKNSMKCWKAAVRNWLKGMDKKPTTRTPTSKAENALAASQAVAEQLRSKRHEN